VKLERLKNLLCTYALVLKNIGSDEKAAWITELAQAMSPHLSQTVDTYLQRVQRGRPSLPAHERWDTMCTVSGKAATMHAVSEVLEGLLNISNALHAYSEAAKLKLLVQLLSGDMRYLTDSLQAMKEDAVTPEPDPNEFVGKLKAASGSEQFERLFRELETSNVRRETIIAIARGMVGRVAASTTRKAALALIRKGHDARMSARRGIEATGGRSAA
jgi:uncharacterized protein with PhoU and TrkA domain